MIKNLTDIFSTCLSAMARAIVAANLFPPDLFVEMAEIRSIGCLTAAAAAPDTATAPTGANFWFCNDSMEISLNVKPANTPLGFLKMLQILEGSIG